MTIASRGQQRGTGLDLWGARDSTVPFSGHPAEVALLSRITGKSAIQVRLAIMKVGNDRATILAELEKPEA